MSILQAIKRHFVRGPIFEVVPNTLGQWFVHQIAINGEIQNVSETYSSKSNAIRAAKRQASVTKNATWRMVK